MATKDKRFAKYRLDQIELKLADAPRPEGLKKKKKDLTCQEALDEYLVQFTTYKTKRTIKCNEACLSRFLKFAKVKLLKQINEQHVEDFLAYRKDIEKLADQTVNHTLTAIRAWLNWAIRKKYIFENVAKEVRMIKLPEAPPRYLSRKETQALLGAAMRHDIYEMLMVALYTGMRVSEIVRFEACNDVDFENNMISVLNKPENPTKNKRWRNIPIHPDLLDILKVMAKREGPSFLTPAGEPYSGAPRRSFLTVRKRANLPDDIGWHNLRHTFATRLYESTGDIRLVQSLLGHQQIETTLRYARLVDAHALRGIKTFDPFNAPKQDTQGVVKKLLF